MTVSPAVVKLPVLMSSDMPLTIAPERFAETGACIEGRLELGKMTRLTGLLGDSQGTVDLKLAFARSGDGITCVTGSYETNLQLICQRCLEPVAVYLANKINVGITFAGTTTKLPASMEPLVLEQETMLLTDFIEDEILLGLPISPMHRLEDCAVSGPATGRNPAGSSPFHVLKELKSG